MTLTGHTGSILNWEKATNSLFTGSTSIASTSATLTGATIGALSATTYFRAVVQSGSCASANSTYVTITIDPTTVPGTVSTVQTICSGSSPSDLTLTGHTGSILNWEKATNSLFTGSTTIASTSSTLTGSIIGALSATTYFRAVVQSGSCPSANSTYATITVTPNLQPSVIISSDDNDNVICEDNLVTFISTPTNGGTSPTYQWYVNGNLSGVGPTFSTFLIDQDIVSCIMKSNLTCISTNDVVSNQLIFTVNSLPNIGYLVSPVTICKGSNFIADVTTSGTVSWSALGTGTFVDNTVEDAEYIPSQADISSGIFTLVLEVAGEGVCNSTKETKNLIVNIKNSSITLLPPSLSMNRDTCFNSPIEEVRFFIGGAATGATVSGLPSGINSSYTLGILKITGSATTSGIFNYAINTLGICPAQPESGVITIHPEILPPTLSSDAIYCFEENETLMTAVPFSSGKIVWTNDLQFGNILGEGLTLKPLVNTGTSTYYAREVLNECSSSNSFINITFKICDIDIPTAFTPDGDDINDNWILSHIDEIYPNNVISIYDRWGSKIFESPKGQYETNTWDGKYNGKNLPVDSYFYIIEYNESNKQPNNGTVTIIHKNK